MQLAYANTSALLWTTVFLVGPKWSKLHAHNLIGQRKRPNIPGFNSYWVLKGAWTTANSRIFSIAAKITVSGTQVNSAKQLLVQFAVLSFELRYVLQTNERRCLLQYFVTDAWCSFPAYSIQEPGCGNRTIQNFFERRKLYKSMQNWV